MLEKSIRGVFLNPRAGLFLQFHLNPTEIEYDKGSNYEEEPITGYHTSHVFWSSNSPMKISFELFFDSRHQSQQAQLFSLGDVGIGVLGTRAILESFLYPAEVDLFQKIEDPSLENLQRLFNSNRFYAPPDVYFVYGPRWFKGKLASAPIKEQSFDKNLIPQQLVTPVSITVLEDGSFKKYNETQRKILSGAESVSNVIELPLNIVL